MPGARPCICAENKCRHLIFTFNFVINWIIVYLCSVLLSCIYFQNVQCMSQFNSLSRVTNCIWSQSVSHKVCVWSQSVCLVTNCVQSQVCPVKRCLHWQTSGHISPNKFTFEQVKGLHVLSCFSTNNLLSFGVS